MLEGSPVLLEERVKEERDQRAKLLCQPPRPELIQNRQGQGGNNFTYISVDDMVAIANSVWGPEGWRKEILDIKVRSAQWIQDPRNNNQQYEVIATAEVRITILATGAYRDGAATGTSRGPYANQAWDTAYKSADSNATKRALSLFGEYLGLRMN